MSEIRIATSYLKSIERRAVLVTADLSGYSSMPGCAITTSPVVGDAYRDLGNRWDQRRNELTAGLHAVAGALSTIRQAFEKVDAELAASVGGGGGG